jgi:carboxyl-terminal processing protease
MRRSLRRQIALLTSLPLLLALPFAQSQTAPAAASSIAPADIPAPAGTAATPASASSAGADQVDLDDIRNFSRVYEVVKQAYVEKVDNKTLMKAAITGMLSGLDPHS